MTFEDKIRGSLGQHDAKDIKKALDRYRQDQVKRAVDEAKAVCHVEGDLADKVGDVLAKRLNFMDDERISQYLCDYNNRQSRSQAPAEIVQPGPALLYAIETRYRSLEVYMYEIERQVETAGKVFDGVATVKDSIRSAGERVGGIISRIKRTKTFNEISGEVKEAYAQARLEFGDTMKQVKQELGLDHLKNPEEVEKAKRYPGFIKEVVRQYAILLAKDVDMMSVYKK